MTNIKLIHPFKDIIPNTDEFFKCVHNTPEDGPGYLNTINSFTNRVKSLSNKYANTIPTELFKGCALELLTEYLCLTNATDNRIGIYNYRPVIGEEDVGVDGFGIGENTKPATVQVKFRPGDYILTDDDHLSRFLTSSIWDFDVDKNDDKNMLIVTTAQKVDDTSVNITLKNRVRVLNREALREMLDNRPMWWKGFWDAVRDSRIKEVPKMPPQTLRPHQQDAVNSVLGFDGTRGKVIMPTGTGKTRIESELIKNEILSQQAMGITPVIKVNSSRILLCFQLFEEVFHYLNSHGVDARYVNYNSGNATESNYINELRATGGVYRHIVSTTSPAEVMDAYAKAVADKLPLIVFSTYHSSIKFSLSGLVPHLTIHDEAHNCVNNEYSKIPLLPSGKDYFFTATEKVTDSDEDLGMNNTERFGDMIHSVCAKNMIDVGEMVKPMVHIVRAKDGIKIDLNKLDRDYDALVKSIASAFHEHEKVIKDSSSTPDEIGAKVLVVCRGQVDLIEMFNTKVFDQFRLENPDIHLYALSSEFGLYVDGEKFDAPVTNAKKYKFLKEVKELKSSDKAIIFHVDMIGEGIDVPGITGVIPFRNCELSKFVQNIGRASRLHPEDRRRVYDGEINANDRSTWIKPHSWVIIPTFLENSEGYSDRFQILISELRSEFGYIPQQDTLIDNVRGLDEELDIDAVNKKRKTRTHSDSGLNEFDHEFESMSVSEQVLFDEMVDDGVTTMLGEFEDLIKN